MRWSVLATISGSVLAAMAVGAGSAQAQVLRVGTYKGIPGQFSSLQRAVDAAKPGDWVLVGPGDYKTTSSRAPKGTDSPAAVLITTPLTLRGMNRNTVVIDGTKPGSPRCSTATSDQNFGPSGDNGPDGLNGIEVWKAPNVSVENLTACNFLGGGGDAGNEIWWNGGDGSGAVGGSCCYYGAYLNATSMYFDPNNTSNAAAYGIFSSNWSGGTWDHTYTSNFNDSGYYIGACQQQCDQTVNHAWAEYSALGYSGSNSGGQLVVENSRFDNNEDGFDTNSQNGDNPPPQDGACPNAQISPITHTHSCWVFMHNQVDHNNNPNVPAAGLAASGPVGTGMSLSGARNDTVMDNTFSDNDAWGTILVPFPDSGPPCTGGTQTPDGTCLYDEFADAILNNTYTNNGSYGNPSNGDIALTNLEPGPTDCFSGNTDTGGTLTTTPSGAQQTYPTCNGQTVPPSFLQPDSAEFLQQVACDSENAQLAGFSSGSLCPPGSNYPRLTQVVMHPLPPASALQSMPRVCGGAPTDAWCGGQVTKVAGCAAQRVRVRLPLSDRERVIWTRVKIGRRHATFHRRQSIRVSLGHRRHRRVRAAFLERIKVGAHGENVRFTRIYRRC